MICRPGLRLRLWLAAAALSTLAITASGIAVFGLSRTQSLATEAMMAQQRIEAYGTYSARVNDWMLGWLMQGQRIPDSMRVDAALDHLDRLIAADVAAATLPNETTRRAGQSATTARLRGLFGQLQKTLSATPPGSPQGDAAIAFYAAQAPSAVAQQIEQEVRRREVALMAMQNLRRPLVWAAIAVAVTAPLVLLALYLLVLRPFFIRLGRATVAAEAMAAGGPLPGAAGHDELGLMFARLRQMAARINRRRARLEQIVAERTLSLSQANDRLAHADADRRRFFADVGHELRSPLTVILGEAELGARTKDVDLRNSFQTIQVRAERLFRRIEDLLRIARSDSGQLQLEHQPVALDQTIVAARSDMASVLRRVGVEIQCDVGPIIVAADPDWLRQVFAGLFENAAKYAGKGACVTIHANSGDDVVQIDITDDGPGVPPGDEERIMERFTRARTVPGFGVGLALARWIVETSGGSLKVIPAAHGLHLRMSLLPWREG